MSSSGSSSACRGRDADQHDGAGQVAGVEGLPIGLGPTDRVDHHVCAVPARQLLDARDGILILRVDGVRRAQLAGRAPASARRGRSR